MPKPITPFVGCDVFVVNENNQVLLIRRSDNNLWALPGGSQDLGETPAEGAMRECLEETGYNVKITELLGVFSSSRYEYVHYPWKENEFTHILFRAEIIGGSPQTSEESLEIRWFSHEALPSLSDGHDIRIQYGFRYLEYPTLVGFFE